MVGQRLTRGIWVEGAHLRGPGGAGALLLIVETGYGQMGESGVVGEGVRRMLGSRKRG